VGKRLDKLDDVEKVCNLEKKGNKIWTVIQYQNKKVNERMSMIEEKLESADF